MVSNARKSLIFKIIEITSKDFGKDDNDGKDSVMWKNRQKDWYNAERRFIFACNSKKERDAWIEKIRED